MHERRHSGNIIAFVMAGGEGSRLRPLTTDRSKPSVPFGARYRLVDFVLSNLINSQITSIYLLVQYKSQELIEHIRRSWVVSPLLPNQFVTVVPPQMHEGSESFKGTADAVYQSLRLIETYQPEYVVVFGADHIYRMDIRQMIRFHCENKADATIAALPVPLSQASSFGVIKTQANGQISEFQEKPENPSPMPSDPTRAFASMGNYVFNTNILVNALKDAHDRGETDFGQHVLPKLLTEHNLYAYNFLENKIPGIKPYEEVGYWRDVGTIDAYFDAHKDVLGAEPSFDAFNPQWPIYSSNYQGPVAKILGGQLENSLIGAAALIENGTSIKNSIIRREAVIEKNVTLENCIIMDYVRIGAGSRLRNVIIDRHNIIQPNTIIGFDESEPNPNYTTSASGITVIPRGLETFFARDSRGTGPGYAE